MGNPKRRFQVGFRLGFGKFIKGGGFLFAPDFPKSKELWTILRRGRDLGGPAEGAGREEQRRGSSPSTVLRRSSPVRGCSSSRRGEI